MGWDLNQEQRYQISAMIKVGRTQKAIATAIGVSQSTVSREISRNGTRKGYYAKSAHARAQQRAAVCHRHIAIPNQVCIDARPPVVDEKTRFGDLEIDLVVGKNHKGKLLTINDRASSIEWIRKVDSKDADVVARMVVETLMPFKGLIKTITSDNGREFAKHEWIAEMLGIDYMIPKEYIKAKFNLCISD